MLMKAKPLNFVPVNKHNLKVLLKSTDSVSVNFHKVEVFNPQASFTVLRSVHVQTSTISCHLLGNHKLSTVS